MSGLGVAWRLLADFVRSRPALVGVYVVLQLLQAVLSGIGLVLLVPLLTVVGVGGGEAGALAAPARFFFDTLGLPESLPVLLGVFVGLVAVREAVNFLSTDVGNLLRVRYTASLRLRLFGAISRASWPFVSALRISDTQHALQGEIGAVSNTVMQLLRTANTLMMLLAYATVTLIVAPAVGLPLLGIALAVTIVGGPLVRRSRSYGTRLLAAQRGAGAITFDHLEGMREAKSFGAEERAIERFGDHLDETIASDIAFRRTQASLSALLGVGSALVLAILAWVAIEGLAGDSLSPASLIVLIYLLSRLIPSAVSLLQTAQQIAHTSPAFESVTDLVDSAEAAREQDIDGEQDTIALLERLLLDGVSFRYSADDPWVLDGVDLAIEAGSLTLVTGSTGSGKTTLADVVMGLVGPQSGHVVVDGTVIDRSTLGAWRRSMAYVPQHTFLFHGTIRDNLLLADPDAADEDLWRVLEAAQVDDRIRRMPGALDGEIGDGGHGLSGGERQRLALARALIRRPSLLVLDEATSALDPETERHILDSVAALGPSTTVLAITHRESAAAYADTIVHFGLDGIEIRDGGRRRGQVS
ncbi:MAG: ABC transporter ATP-binding protein [Actinomycetia bacterium]|nr:ABC transporter ATP-binding protein [Actinomycetes bacterium]